LGASTVESNDPNGKYAAFWLQHQTDSLRGKYIAKWGLNKKGALKSLRESCFLHCCICAH